VRQVIHWGPPPTLEAYYQEAGRGGRDGRASDCLVLWRHQDLAWGNIAPAMRRYVEAPGCRRRMLLDYFGERLTSCSGCDVCRSGSDQPGAARTFVDATIVPPHA
jgi:ATP-dependent DNA helicase RecQ